MVTGLKKMFKIMFCGGLSYYLVEFIYRIIADPTSINVIQATSMGIVGGTSVYLMGLINEKYKYKMIIQSLIGTAIVLVLELLSGILFNIVLKLNIWDYSDLPFNILGQVCPQFAFAWLFLVPLGIWIDDMVRSTYEDEEEARGLRYYYKDFFTLK